MLTGGTAGLLSGGQSEEGTNSKIVFSLTARALGSSFDSISSSLGACCESWGAAVGSGRSCDAGPTLWCLLNYFSLQQQHCGLSTSRELLHFSDG